MYNERRELNNILLQVCKHMARKSYYACTKRIRIHGIWQFISMICVRFQILYDLVLFADDTNLFFSHFDSTTSMNLVNSKMLKLFDWFKAKTNYLLIYESQIT